MTKYSCTICHQSSLRQESGLFDDRYGAPGKHSIYVCNTCGFGKTKPGLKKEQIGKFYSQYYPISGATPQLVKESVRRLSPFKKWLTGTDNICHEYARRRQIVLDVGSASGVSLLEIAMRGAKAYGVEPDPNGKRLARSLRLKVHTGFITDNPFPRLQFDLVTGSQVIEHEPDPLAFLLAMRYKLKKHGQIILSFPNYGAFYRLLFGKRWIHYHIPYHLNFFTHDSVKILANRAGLKIVSMRTITPNEWTLLQLRMLMTLPPREGIKSPIWHSASRKSTTGHGFSRYLGSALYLTSRTILLALTPINRFLDLLGIGESFLVTMEQK